jgi:methylglutaconyl-CoA hydratase
MEIYVKHYREAAVGVLEFGDPSGNSLRENSLKELQKQLLALEADEKVRVIILQSAGSKAFCGGASFTEMKELKDINQATVFFMGFANVINTLRSLSKFVIARIQGKVVGGGVGLVSACDFAIATKSAYIKLSELSIGLGPYVIEPAVSRKIGSSAFSQLSLDTENWKNPEWSLSKGLFADVVKNEDELNKKVNETAERISAYSPQAVKSLKKLHWKNTDHWETLLPKNAEITARLVLEKTTQKILKNL